MVSEPLRPKLTYEDFLGLPDDGKRHELIDGEHYMTPAPSVRHQSVVAALTHWLRAHVLAEDLGLVLPAPVDVVLSEHDIVEPDLIFLSNERRDRVTEANIQGAPDLVVEVLSDSTRRRDEITKRHLYERRGVREYWLVDPELQTVKGWRAGGRGVGRTAEVAAEGGGGRPGPGVPGFEVALRRLFPWPS